MNDKLIANGDRSSPVKAFVEKAEKTRLKFGRESAKGKSDTQILTEIITNPAVQVVVGIWADRTEPEGVAVRVIKGDTQIARVFSGDSIQFDAIFCRCFEEAEAMRRVLGDARGSSH